MPAGSIFNKTGELYFLPGRRSVGRDAQFERESFAGIILHSAGTGFRPPSPKIIKYIRARENAQMDFPPDEGGRCDKGFSRSGNIAVGESFPPAVSLLSLYLSFSPFFSLFHFIIGLSPSRFVDDLVVLKRASSYGSRHCEDYMGRLGENG